MRKLVLWLCAALVAFAVLFPPWELTVSLRVPGLPPTFQKTTSIVYQFILNPPNGYSQTLANMGVYPYASVLVKLDQLALELVGIGMFAGLGLAATKKRDA